MARDHGLISRTKKSRLLVVIDTIFRNLWVSINHKCFEASNDLYNNMDRIEWDHNVSNEPDLFSTNDHPHATIAFLCSSSNGV